MSIRLKLLLSYAAMLFIPLVMIIITAILLTIVFRGDLQNIRDTYSKDPSAIENKFENQGANQMLKEIKRVSENNPALLSNPAYWTDVDQELSSSRSYLIVRKGNDVLFVSPAFQDKELLNHLHPYEHPGKMEKAAPQRYGNEIYEANRLDFKFADNRPGSMFVVKTLSPFVHFAQKFFPILFTSLLLILVLTHTLLTYFVSRSIIKPLQALKKAMKRMEEGDLDYEVQVTGKDEIGQLSAAFESMRKQLQQSINTQLQYEENRKELISNISHDLRTPLTAIRGYVDGLEEGVADTPDKRKKYIEIISSKAEEMDQLIDELFLYSRLDLNRLPFNFEIIDMHDFITDWSEELDFELGKKGVRFSSSIDLESGSKASVDRDKIRRVFNNIIDNCLKYMNKPVNRIELRVHAANNLVIIEVEDNGRGINPEALPFIFERFYRAEPSRNSDTGGSGLGLAISKQIMDGHGGTIQAASTHGEGTCITMTLPTRRG
ncbi:sensor histidine kinase [Paenibacillus piri]|uniref:histidine kinase n=1 Tax=Paenibacillus piri TaxID=2547395 RepID=A0A4R5KJX6_9BACL|nr:HAMP domain-containing sensor histidine kinase [Paenibacillus piri]TDF95138.1 HAMP domain-containing histidine kinase [Paenibacillus piri]